MRVTKTRQFLCGILGLLACAAFVPLSHAARVNGFESGDPAVLSIGDAGAVGSFQGEAPPEGNAQYLLTTIGTQPDGEDGLTPISGSAAVPVQELQTFFNGISLSGGQEGSGVLIPFTVSAGDNALTFQYDFLSNEVLQTTVRPDFAFALIFDGANVLQSGASFADVNTNFNSFQLFNPDQAPFQFHLGYQTLSLSLDGLAPGSYVLGIGVADSGTTDHASGLLIDDVETVPEASPIALIAVGAILVFVVRKRIRLA